MKEALLTTKELAEMLQVSSRTIMRWMKFGLPHIKIERTTRFDQDSVSEWLSSKHKKV